MQSTAGGVADVHRGARADVLDPLEHLDHFFGISSARAALRGGLLRVVFSHSYS
jgi:hypothetical protein